MIPSVSSSVHSPGRIFNRVHPCLSPSIRVRWRPFAVDRNARDHLTRMNTDQQRAGAPDQNTLLPSAYLSALGVENNFKRRGRRGRRVRDAIPRVFLTGLGMFEFAYQAAKRPQAARGRPTTAAGPCRRRTCRPPRRWRQAHGGRWRRRKCRAWIRAPDCRETDVHVSWVSPAAHQGLVSSAGA